MNALDYAANGYAVFPCRDDKTPHTPNGFHAATTDPAVIGKWWAQWPDALVGIDPSRSGLAVVDVDQHSGAPDGFETLANLGFDLMTDTVGSSLSGKGAHYWHRGTSSSGKLLPGVDVKSVGGYVIAVYDLPPAFEIQDTLPEWAVRAEAATNSQFDGSVTEWMRTYGTKTPDALVRSIVAKTPNPFRGHEAMLKLQLNLIHGAVRDDWEGVPDALASLREKWVNSPHGPTDPDPGLEWDRALASAISMAGGVDFSKGELIREDSPSTESATSSSHGHIKLTPASAIVPLRATWVMTGRIPLGELTLLAGGEGLGKSTMLYDIAARATRGQLDGEFKGIPKSVMVAATEDSWEHTIVPRLMAAGADLTRVFQVETVERDGLVFPRDNESLGAAAVANDVSLLILDPLTSRLGGADTHKDSEVRKALEPVVQAAGDGRFAVVGIIHLNKNESAKNITNRIMGSRAFSALARSVIAVFPDPDDEEDRRRIIGLVKANLTSLADDKPDVFEIVSASVQVFDPFDGTEVTTLVGAVKHLGHSEMSMKDAADTDRKDDSAAAIDRCAAFIESYLRQNGTVSSSEVKTEAAAFNSKEFYARAVDRARTKLGNRVTITRDGKHTMWTLNEAVAA